LGYGAPVGGEAKLQRSSTGVVPASEGWFVLNARDARWFHVSNRSAVCEFEGDTSFPQVGANVSVRAPGQSMSMYHWEADQEDFLVLADAGLLIIEGVERSLRPWDFVHCPAGTSHVIVGAGHGPCVVLAVGARDQSTGENWGGSSSSPLRSSGAPALSTRQPIRSRRMRAYRGADRSRMTRSGCRKAVHKAVHPAPARGSRDRLLGSIEYRLVLTHCRRTSRGGTATASERGRTEGEVRTAPPDAVAVAAGS